MAKVENVTYRIGMVQACFMVGVAVIADLLQVLLDLTGILAIASDIVTFLAESVLGIWFMINGVQFTSGKRALSKFLTAFGTTIIELVPIIDALPTLTIGTIFIIHASRKEDREKTKEAQERAVY